MVPLIAAFTFVFLAELGDKTQLAAIMLSSKASAASVFVGAMLAFFVVDGISALIGGKLLGFLPYKWLGFISGSLLLAFGIISLIHRDDKVNLNSQGGSLLKTFSLISLMELGDKTQFASILLAAEFNSSLIVLLGIMLAFSVITGIGVIFGRKLLRILPEKYLQVGTSLLFIFFGLIFILNAVTGVVSEYPQ